MESKPICPICDTEIEDRPYKLDDLDVCEACYMDAVFEAKEG